MCYEAMEYGVGYIGNLYLKMAWIARERNKKDDEKMYLQLTVNNLEKALENKENFAGQLTELGTTYLMGELNRRIEDYEKAEKYFNKVIEVKNSTKEKSIVKLAEVQYEHLKLERTQKVNEDNS